jgi:hypothetical protein
MMAGSPKCPVKAIVITSTIKKAIRVTKMLKAVFVVSLAISKSDGVNYVGLMSNILGIY